ncbi:MAG: MBL fold metallo-hydrolase [Gemmatimonadaceae bacterium]
MHFPRSLTPFAQARFAALAALAVALASPTVPIAGPLAAQQRDVAQTPVNIIRLTENTAMLVGAGGNIGVSIGTDGTFLVDDQFAPLTPKIRAILDSVDKRSIRFVLNTHWHGDHTGGNENLGKAGALIVAHENVRRRMSVGQFIRQLGDTVAPSPSAALPVVTFTDAVTFHLNDDEIHAFRVPPAHTDGDAIVHFRKANVIHMGDTYFNGSYPFIDLSSGGSLEGMVHAADTAIALSNESTRVIPGHGALSNKGELTAYRDMLAAIRDRIRKQVVAGKKLDAVLASKPTQEWDETWGKGFIKPAQFVETAYTSLAADVAAAKARPAARKPASKTGKP